MYRERPNLMIGFHGCDEFVRDDLVNKPDNVKSSKEAFDWLGHGFYIWENNYARAVQWAKDKARRGVLTHPSVVGVVYQLNNCLDFTDSEYINLLGTYYEIMKKEFELSEIDLPKNKNLPKDNNNDLILRELDCAVIQYLHQKVEEEINEQHAKNGYSALKRFDTVRGVFTEGGPAFEGAGIQTKNHIQICIRNLNCIKGFFIPRKEVSF